MSQEMKINAQVIVNMCEKLTKIEAELDESHTIEVINSKGELANKVNELSELCEECRGELSTVTAAIRVAINNAKEGYIGADEYIANAIGGQHE